MKIYNSDNQLILDVTVDDSSYRQKSIMSDNIVVLKFSLTEFVEFPVMSWCEFKGVKYTLYKPAEWKQIDSRNWEYTLIMGSYQYILGKVKLRSLTDVPKRLKFSLHGDPHMFLYLIVQSLNARDSGWTIGECIEAEGQLIDFNSDYCWDALRKIADAFKTEFEIVGKTLHLRKVEYEKDFPITLGYGKDKGFKSGTSRTNYDNGTAVSRLYVQGGERNIDRNQYNGSDVLLLPRNEEIIYQGRKYKTDSEGLYLERTDITNNDITEGDIDLSYIYPKRIGVVSEVVAVDDSNCLYDIIDNTIPADLDYNKFLIPNEKILLVFQSGLLAGKEYELNKYIHTTTGNDPLASGRFELVPVDNLPKSPIIPAVDDTYAIYNIMLPESYVKSAENEMLSEAVRYKYDNEDPRLTFSGDLDEMYAKRHWLEIGGKLDVGYYVNFTNEAISEPVLIRITGVKESINAYKMPTLTLSNVSQGNAFASKMDDVKKQEVTEDRKDKYVMDYAKRRWQDILQTRDMMYDPEGDFFQDMIRPLWVQTMGMVVGTESLQFQFLDNDWVTVVTPSFEWDESVSQFRAPASKLQHMTLGIDSVRPIESRGASDYKFWEIDPYTSPNNLDPDKGYYLYVKCSKDGNTANGRWVGAGTFVLSENPIAMDAEDGYYYFLTMFLLNEFDNNRDMQRMYGYTQILPGQITTDEIRSSDGQNFWNLVNSMLKIGNANSGMDWTITKPNTLTIRGVINQSPSGDTNVLGVFRGAYNVNTIYYDGDEVTYNGSTYRYIYPTSASGKTPPNAMYWTVVAAKGIDGIDGNDGQPGQSLCFRGDYNSSTVYYGTSSRGDVVKYAGLYYRTNYYAGTFSNIVPTNTYYWTPFGATFESVATGLLFAATALIAGWNFNNDVIWSNGSPGNITVLDGRNNALPAIAVGSQAVGNVSTAPFRVLRDGSVIATRGEIGGFKLESSHIGTTMDSAGMALFNEFIKFSDDNTWAGIGTSVFPASSGLSGLGRFRNATPNNYGVNYGIVVEVLNAVANIAFKAQSGAIVGDNVVVSRNYGSIYPATNQLVIINPTTGIYDSVVVKFQYSNSAIGLPSRYDIANLFGIGMSTPFKFRLLVVCDATSTQQGNIYGRTTSISTLNSAIYPERLNNNGAAQNGGLPMGSGDIDEFLLVWDGVNYKAYPIGHLN